MNEKPEALRLAAKLKSYSLASGYAWHCHNAADELRRLHEVNQELLEALKSLVLATERVSIGDYSEEAHDIALSNARATISKAIEETT